MADWKKFCIDDLSPELRDQMEVSMTQIDSCLWELACLCFSETADEADKERFILMNATLPEPGSKTPPPDWAKVMLMGRRQIGTSVLQSYLALVRHIYCGPRDGEKEVING